jgi:hypothetical protein
MYSKSSESLTTADAAGSKLIVGAPNRHNPGETIDAVETDAVGAYPAGRQIRHYGIRSRRWSRGYVLT